MRSRAWSVPPVAAVAAGTLAAGTVLADSQRVLDAPGDGRGGCEILATTAGHAADRDLHDQGGQAARGDGGPEDAQSYFWSANGCFRYPDWAPDTGSGREQVKAHRFQP